MFAEPLNGKKDEKPPVRRIAGHQFSRLTDRCELIHTHCEGAVCNKLYSEIACAPESAIQDHNQRGLWAGEAQLTRAEWLEIQLENSRILGCCRS